MASRAREIEERVGHPGDKWDALIDRVQSGALRRFSALQEDWLDLVWTPTAKRAYHRQGWGTRKRVQAPD